MKLKWLLSNSQIIVSALGVAAFAAGCCTSHKAAAGGTAETTETTTSTSTAAPSGQVSGTQTIPLYKEQVNVGARQVEDGAVTIRKIVKTETVNQPVTLQKETLIIDRQPSATGAESGAQPFQNQEVTIQLHHEEPFVSTQVVPNGQVVATTKTDSQQTTIQKQVRSEDVAVDKGNAQNVIIQGNVNSGQNSMGGTGDNSEQSTGGSQNQNQ